MSDSDSENEIIGELFQLVKQKKFSQVKEALEKLKEQNEEKYQEFEKYFRFEMDKFEIGKIADSIIENFD